MLLRHNTLVHQYIYGTVPFQSLTRCHTRIRSRSRTREKPLLAHQRNGKIMVNPPQIAIVMKPKGFVLEKCL